MALSECHNLQEITCQLSYTAECQRQSDKMTAKFGRTILLPDVRKVFGAIEVDI